MPPKKEVEQTEKTPLQKQKEEEKEELKNPEASEKPKKRRRSKKKKVDSPSFDAGNAEKEAYFFLEMITLTRKGLGVNATLGDLPSQTFVTSYVKIAEKYGSVVNKWLPEIMFVGSCSLIAFDTFKELKKLPEIKEVAEQANLEPISEEV